MHFYTPPLAAHHQRRGVSASSQAALHDSYHQGSRVIYHLGSGRLRSRLCLWHLQLSATEVRGLGMRVLGVVVGNGGLDGILGKHRAVQFHGWQAELLGNLSVLNFRGLVQGHAADELRQITGAGNGGAASERLELDIADGVRVWVHLDLQLHHIAAGRSAYETGAHIVGILVHRSDVARL